MGANAPAGQGGGELSTTGRTPLSVDELERWVEHGAQWRLVEMTGERAVVELCTCYGEPVDLREGNAPELIDYLRAHRPG